MKIFFDNANMCPMRRVNIYHYKNALLQSGYTEVNSFEEADVVLVWTCAFRTDMEENSMGILLKYQNMGKKAVAAGCLPSISPHKIEQFHGGVVHYNNAREDFQEVFGIDINHFDYPVCERSIALPIEEFRKKHNDKKVVWDDQYIKLFIQQGCTRKCSYCTEIRAFPKFMSHSMDKLLQTVTRVVKQYNNYQIAIMGDDIGAYGLDIGTSLPQLVKKIVDIDDRIRISLKQIHPYYMMRYMDELLPFIESGKIFQILIPIQSSNDRILQLMDRGYTKNDLKYIFDKLQNTRTEIETHIIAGFPTETDEEWWETIDFLTSYNNIKYVMGNVYMAGEGTKAASMNGQIDEETKKRRMLAGAKALEENHTVIGHSYNENGKTHITKKKLEMIVW